VSLRLRLLVAIGVVALAALAIADVVTYQELRSFLYTRIDQSLEQSHLPIEGALSGGPGGVTHGGIPPRFNGSGADGAGAGSAAAGTAHTASNGTGTGSDGDDAPAEAATGCGALPGVSGDALRELPPGTLLEVRAATGTVVCRTIQPQLGAASPPFPTLPSHITGFASDASDFDEPTTYLTAPATSGGSTAYRVRASVLRSGPYAGGELLVGTSLGSTASTLDRLLAVELIVTGAALVGALALGWWLVRVGLRPLRAVEATAEAIAQGELDQRVPGEAARTEVGRLARALNVMLARIERAFAQRDATEVELRQSEERMRQLVADASHELRTPLTAVAAYAELFEQGASTRHEDLERVMKGIRTETARMGRLVEDLLLLARLDEGRPLEREEVELVGVAAEAVQTAATVGPQWPIHLVAHDPVEVVGDRLRIRQVVDNLLANVRTHCPPGTDTTVTVESSADDALLTVSDDGPGISAEHAEHLFERFFRVDPSRSRRHGGAGLGLSIVASIVQAHGGTVEATATPQGGATFRVRLPRAGASGQTGEVPALSQETPI